MVVEEGTLALVVLPYGVVFCVKTLDDVLVIECGADLRGLGLMIKYSFDSSNY